jgi:FAM192A/Fyv6, N-terminal domain
MSLSFVSKSIQTTRNDGGYDEEPIEDNGKSDGTTNHTANNNYTKPLFEQIRENQERDDQEREDEKIRIMRGTLALDDEDAAHLQSIQQRKEQIEYETLQRTQYEMDAFRVAQAHRHELQFGQNSSHYDDDEEKNNGTDKSQDNIDKSSIGNGNVDIVTPSAKIELINQSNIRKPTIVPKFITKKRRRNIEPTTSGDVLESYESSSINQQQQNNRKNTEDVTNIHYDKILSIDDCSSSSGIRNSSNISYNYQDENSSTKAVAQSNALDTTVPVVPATSITGLLTGYGSSSSDDDDE